MDDGLFRCIAGSFVQRCCILLPLGKQRGNKIGEVLPMMDFSHSSRPSGLTRHLVSISVFLPISHLSVLILSCLSKSLCGGESTLCRHIPLRPYQGVEISVEHSTQSVVNAPSPSPTGHPWWGGAPLDKLYTRYVRRQRL